MYTHIAVLCFLQARGVVRTSKNVYEAQICSRLVIKTVPARRRTSGVPQKLYETGPWL